MGPAWLISLSFSDSHASSALPTATVQHMHAHCVAERLFCCSRISPLFVPPSASAHFCGSVLLSHHLHTRPLRPSCSHTPSSCMQEFYDAKSDTISMRSTHSDSISEGCVRVNSLQLPFPSPAMSTNDINHCAACCDLDRSTLAFVRLTCRSSPRSLHYYALDAPLWRLFDSLAPPCLVATTPLFAARLQQCNLCDSWHSLTSQRLGYLP